MKHPQSLVFCICLQCLIVSGFLLNAAQARDRRADISPTRFCFSTKRRPHQRIALEMCQPDDELGTHPASAALRQVSIGWLLSFAKVPRRRGNVGRTS